MVHKHFLWEPPRPANINPSCNTFEIALREYGANMVFVCARKVEPPSAGVLEDQQCAEARKEQQADPNMIKDAQQHTLWQVMTELACGRVIMLGRTNHSSCGRYRPQVLVCWCPSWQWTGSRPAKKVAGVMACVLVCTFNISTYSITNSCCMAGAGG